MIMRRHRSRRGLRRRYGHARASLSWNTFAGGTSAHHGNSYSADGWWGKYTIDPPQRRGGSYHLMWANTTSQPAPHGGLWHDLGHFRSPGEAKGAAKRHMQGLKT